MSFSGDLSAMSHLADRIADLASVPFRAAKRVAFDLEGFLQAEFDAGKDPYGRSWAPLAEATLDTGRTPPPLTDTEDLRGSVQVRPMQRAGVAITVGAPYAPPHQTGWVGPRSSGPARPMLPAGGVLPAAWRDAIEDAVEKEVRR